MVKCYYDQKNKEEMPSVLEQHKELEAKKHNKLTKKNSTKASSKSTHRSEQISLIKKLMPDAKSVLCAGCRDDSEVLSFVKAGFEARGIDVNHETKLISKTSMEEMPDTIGEKSYDIVYSRHSLEHVAFPLVALESIRKVSKLGCFIIIPFENKEPRQKHPSIFDIMTADPKNLSNQGLERWLELLKEDFSGVEPYELIHYSDQLRHDQREMELFLRWA